MIYTGLNRTGEIADIKSHGGNDISEVYGGIGESNPIYYKQREIVGTSPMQFKALGLSLTDYRIYGETLQDGTPSPDMPVDVVGCGEQTENLFDGRLQQGYYAYTTGWYTLEDTYVCTHQIPCTENTTYTFKCINTGGGSKNYGYVFFDSARNRIGSDYIDRQTVGDVVTHTATTPQNTAFLAIDIAYGRRQERVVRPSDITNFVLNSGYKLPVTVNGTEYPIYIGTVQTTRKIRKLVLSGQETFEYQPEYSRYILIVRNAFADGIRQTPCFCSHYQSVHNGEPIDDVPNLSIYINQSNNGSQFCIKDQGITELVVFKAFLANQYSAGKPITIWYILDVPENVIVNEPLMKIGDYADTISFAQAGVTIPTVSGTNTLTVDTTVKPSQMYIKGKIKPDGYGNLTDKNGVYILDKDGVQLTVHGQGTSN